MRVPGRTLERLDPFDPAHPNHLLLINGMSGAGKTMAAIVLLARAIGAGRRRVHHRPRRALRLPGLAAPRREHRPDRRRGARDQLLGRRRPGARQRREGRLPAGAARAAARRAPRRTRQLRAHDLESNLLGLAIVEVYERCALTGEEPRELLLQEELERRYHSERAEGSVGIAEALRNLSMRLNNYLRDGPYGYLTDRPTTIPPDSPLVVFDTRMIPDAKAAAALFVICEHVKSADRARTPRAPRGRRTRARVGRTALPRDRRGMEADRAARHGTLVQRVLPPQPPLRAVARRDQPAAVRLRDRAWQGAARERRDAAVPAPGSAGARLRQGHARALRRARSRRSPSCRPSAASIPPPT